MTDNKVCLIIAFYFGNRDSNSLSNDELLKTQLFFFNKTKHNLSKIVFAISEDDRTEIEIKEKDGITYFYKGNNGLSFGSWFTVVSHYQDGFDYYIFSEDDYVMVMDNFDDIFIKEYQRLQPVEYVVNWSQYNHQLEYRGGLISTIGIVTPNVIKRITNNFEKYPWPNHKGGAFSRFLKSFRNIGTVSLEYSAFPYWGAVDKKTKVFLYGYQPKESVGSFTKRMMMCPIQMIDTSTKTIIQPDLRNILNVGTNQMHPNTTITGKKHKFSHNLISKQRGTPGTSKKVNFKKQK